MGSARQQADVTTQTDESSSAVSLSLSAARPASASSEQTGWSSWVGSWFSGPTVDACSQTDGDAVLAETERLALYVIYNAVGRRERPAPDDCVCRTLCRCIDDILAKHSILFDGMMKQLKIEQVDGYRTFKGVADELFEGEVTWSRIITLFAFSVRLAKYCQDLERDEYVAEVYRYLMTYISDTLMPFIRKQSGWESIRDHFYYSDIKSASWFDNIAATAKLGISVYSITRLFA